MLGPGTVRFESLEGRTLMSGNPLTISTASYLEGKQLRITGTAGDDQISLRRTTAGLLVSNGDWSTTARGSFKSIRINSGAGNDSVTVGSNITRDSILYGGDGNDTLLGGSGNDRIYGGAGNDRTAGGAGNDTLVSIGGGSRDTLLGGRGADAFWTDPTDTVSDADSTESTDGSIHRVTRFQSYSVGAGGAATTVNVGKEPRGQNLADPGVTDGAYTYRNFSTHPLFSDAGPAADDVIQGQVGDCYFLSVLSSIAKVDPGLIRRSIADLGDGTYAVQFTRDDAKVYIRVDADLAAGSNGAPAYADLGAQGSLWVALMEKAFTYFRSPVASYSAIEAGWMSEAYDAMGTTSTEHYYVDSATTLISAIEKALSAGKSATYAVNNPRNGAPLIGGHAYMVDSTVKDSSGAVTGLRLRNPWAIDGAGDDGIDDGYVTITPAQAYTSFLGFATAWV